MAAAERRAEAVWEGNLTEGRGRLIKVGSGAIGDLPVTWASRTESSDGKTSPEELIAAAHATCFSMAISNILNKGGTPPDRVRTSAIYTADRVDGKFTILSVDLDVTGRVPGADAAAFEAAANLAKEDCPVSRALKGNVQMRVKARLEGGE
jgi:lipoyl-dependent peroxiredoxin